MTDERRREIIAKDYISAAEFREMTGLSQPSASKLMTFIRTKYEGRGSKPIEGYIRTVDYLRYLGIDTEKRYERSRAWPTTR